MTTTSVNAPPPDVVERFGGALVGLEKSVLDLADLLVAWASADAWAGSPAGRLRLSDALERLDAVGLINLPARNGSLWDPALPRLPLRVSIPANRRALTRALDPAEEPWVPALSWVGAWIRASRPPQRLRLALVAVNRWLASTTGGTPAVISREERSLDMFEDEKVLASLCATPLFGIGRLSLELLRCEAPLGGLRVGRLADAGPVLVLENKATFDSAWRALRADLARGRPTYAAVVFGGGDQAASLVPDLRTLGELVGVNVSRCDYAGDVDVAGVSAAAAFIDASRREGLTAGPALPLWTAVAEARPAGEDLTGDSREREVAIAACQRFGLPEGVASRLREGVRVPQERIDRTRLADTSWWVPRAR